MDFNLSEEQEILKRSARTFLAKECPFEVARALVEDEGGCPPELWHKMAELGWMGLPFPERYGGAGFSLLDLAVLLEEMGRANAPTVFLNAMIGGLAVLEAGNEQQKSKLLPPIAQGASVTTLAVLEPSLRFEQAAIRASATASASGYILNGTKLFVPDADSADYVICAMRTSDHSEKGEGISLITVPLSAVKDNLTALRTLAGDKQFELKLDGVEVSTDDVLGMANEGWGPLSRVMQMAAAGKCAEMLGAMQKALDLSVAQGQDRKQFGVPVGSFQAVQHHCANMLVDITLSRFLTYQAAWMLSEGQSASKQVSIAKAFVGDAYLRVMALAHEVLGGNGLIEEHEMPLFSKRALGAEQFFGSSDYHRELVARALGL